MPVGRGLGTYQQKKMAAELSVVLEVLSNDLKNYFFGEEGDNLICLAATAFTFRQENQQSASTVFSLDAAQKHAGSPNHASKRKTQVPTKKKEFVFTCRVVVVF